MLWAAIRPFLLRGDWKGFIWWCICTLVTSAVDKLLNYVGNAIRVQFLEWWNATKQILQCRRILPLKKQILRHSQEPYTFTSSYLTDPITVCNPVTEADIIEGGINCNVVAIHDIEIVITTHVQAAPTHATVPPKPAWTATTLAYISYRLAATVLLVVFIAIDLKIVIHSPRDREL